MPSVCFYFQVIPQTTESQQSIDTLTEIAGKFLQVFRQYLLCLVNLTDVIVFLSHVIDTAILLVLSLGIGTEGTS